MADAPKKSNISKGTWMVLIGIALFFDALEAIISFIPIAGEIIAMGIDGVAFATFWLIFKMNNETYSKKTFIGGFVVGFIPIVNMLPECTLTIVMLYVNSKAKKIVAKVPGGQLATQAAIQGHMAKNTVIVNGERKNKSDMGNRNAKPAFNRFQDVPSNKQKNNTSNLQEQADSMKKLESIKTPGQSSVGNLRETSKQNSNPTQRPPKQESQHMKEWKEATEKLNKQKNDEFIEKNYGGGMEKYKADEAKHNADWKRMQEGQAKFKESTKRYDNLFNGNNSEGGPPQIAKE